MHRFRPPAFIGLKSYLEFNSRLPIPRFYGPHCNIVGDVLYEKFDFFPFSRSMDEEELIKLFQVGLFYISIFIFLK